MKKFFFVLLCLLAAGWLFAQKKGDTMYVSVKTADLKNGTGFFAKKTATVAYGDQVTVLAVNGKWAQVQSGTKSGWISSANLTSKKIVAQGSGSASAKELALAGKGFSEEVEQEYKTGQNLDYSQVDALEKVKVSDEDLLSFIQEGRLAAGE
jgi:uncharacterized protein YgiM (DUF1202 family)